MADVDDILPIFEDGESTDSGMEDLVFRLWMVDCFGNGGYWPSEQERECIFVVHTAIFLHGESGACVCWPRTATC